jgi:low temperature requirement protein LtrA
MLIFWNLGVMFRGDDRMLVIARAVAFEVLCPLWASTTGVVVVMGKHNDSLQTRRSD